MKDSPVGPATQTGREKFVLRLNIQRAVGLFLGLSCVASVFYGREVPAWKWAASVAVGLGWPQLAHFLSRKSPDKLASEIRNLKVDSFIGGFFLPVIFFNLLPSAAFVTMLSMNNLGVGGLALFLRGLALIAVGAALGTALCGLKVDPMPTVLITAVSLPMLVAYPLITGAIANKLSTRLRQRRDELQELYTTETLHVATLSQANEKLSRAEEKYRRLTEEINDTIFEIDNAGKIVYISPAMKALTGFEPGEFYGKHFTEAIHPEDLERLLIRFKAVLDGEFTPTEYRIKRKDGGYVWVRSSSRAVVDGGKATGIRGVLTNIEDIKRGEEERAALTAKLHARQKGEMLGTLAGGIAHDFNNILGGILGYSEILESHIPEGSEGRLYLKRLQTATERAASVVRQILSVAGRRDESGEVIDLCAILGEAAEMLRASNPPTIAVEVRCPKEKIAVRADPAHIHQIVMNLGTNACQALTPRGGRVVISAETEDAGTPLALLTVKDDGPGIAPEIADRIFDPYFTTKGVGKGSGLGLAVVKGIVTTYEGQVALKSAPGEGATFTVRLPLATDLPQAGGNDEDLAPRGSERLIFVDDEAAIRELAEKNLAALGYSVKVFDDPTRALAELQKAPGDCDMLITDMAMASLTGLELTLAALKLRPDLPVLICTGYSEALDASKTAKIGAKGLLYKPIKRNELARAVRTILDAR